MSRSLRKQKEVAAALGEMIRLSYIESLIVLSKSIIILPASLAKEYAPIASDHRVQILARFSYNSFSLKIEALSSDLIHQLLVEEILEGMIVNKIHARFDVIHQTEGFHNGEVRFVMGTANYLVTFNGEDGEK